ncbi:MAG: AAA family ATPase [Gammaproteobacteria bacterium]
MTTASDRPPEPAGVFSSEPAGADCFQGADFVARLHLLQHLIDSSDLMVLVVGPDGSGKTTLLEQLARRGADRWQICRVAPAPGLSAGGVLKQIAQCCELPTDCGDVAMTHLLIERAGELRRSDRVPLLVVDDAQVLGLDALAAVIGLGGAPQDQAAAWHILLLSEPGLEGTLVTGRGPLPPSGKLQVVRLAPLTAAETAEYVKYRLERAGVAAAVELSPEQVAQLHREGRGLPGGINAAARRLFAVRPTQPTSPPVRKRGCTPRRKASTATSSEPSAVIKITGML